MTSPHLIHFGIKIATYHRPAGDTLSLLTRALDSVRAQTHSRWTVFLIGDCYDPPREFAKVVDDFGRLATGRIVSVNLRRAVEREKYVGHQLWCVGGVTAMNTAIDAMLEYDVRYIACLDHDDYWLPKHLESLAQAYCWFPEAAFVYTKGKCPGAGFWGPTDWILPPESVPIGYHNRPPQGCHAFHSTLSWDLHRLPLRYRDLNLHGVEKPADADLLDRAAGFCRRNGLKTVHVPEVTAIYQGS